MDWRNGAIPIYSASFSASLAVRDSNKAKTPDAWRVFGPLSIGEWCLLSIIDHPYFEIKGRFIGVASEETLAKVGGVKRLLDTTEVLDTLDAWSSQDREVHGLGLAVAVAYLAHILGDTDKWLTSHQVSIASARSVLASASIPAAGMKFDLQCGIACLTLAGMPQQSEERSALLKGGVASATGENAFLGVIATLELCRDSIKAGRFEEARQLADSGIKKYETPAYWINIQILRKIRRHPAEGLDGYTWLSPSP
jgi:hypothetical protein